MSQPHPKSIYLNSSGELAVKEVKDSYIPQGSQSLVKVQYSGINQCDLNFFHAGLHSYITGFDLAGTVVEAGPTSPFKVGDIVCGMSPVSFPKPSSVGTHQDLAIGEADLLYPVPTGLGLKDSGAVCLTAQTAIDALFNGLGFGLPGANFGGKHTKDHPILIWGGASSVGVLAIRIAKAVGFNPIFTTASPKNHATLKSLGATECFDYKATSVADDIQTAAKARGVTLTTAFDTVGNGLMIPGVKAELTSPALTKKALSGNSGSEYLNLVCTLPVPNDTAFKSCFSYRPSGSVGPMGGPQDAEAPIRIRKAMEYFLRSREVVLKFPQVTVVKGAEEGIREIGRVAGGGASLEKVVIEHPM